MSPRQNAQPHTTLIAAHRGGAGLWPENSMEAFRNAAKLAVDQVEFDVHPTRDGHLVVHHDPTLERMTDGTGPLADRTLKELLVLTIAGTEHGRIPLFADVLGLFRESPLDVRVEIKADADFGLYSGLEAKLASEITESGMMDRTVITSFYIDALLNFRSLARPSNLIWLVKKPVIAQIGGLESALEIATSREIDEIALHQSLIGPEEITAAATAGIHLGAYAVNDEDAIRKMLELGIPVFTSDRPDIALKMRDRIQGS